MKLRVWREMCVLQRGVNCSSVLPSPHVSSVLGTATVLLCATSLMMRTLISLYCEIFSVIAQARTYRDGSVQSRVVTLRSHWMLS